MIKARKVVLIIFGVLFFLIAICISIIHASHYSGNVFFMIKAINQLKVDSDGIIKIDKNTYLTRANEDIASLFEDRGYEVIVFFTRCDYRKKGDAEYKRVYGKMYTSRYIIWAIPDSDLE